MTAQSRRFGYVPALFVALVVFLAATAPAWLMASLVSSLSSGKVQLEQPEGDLWNGRAAFVNYTLPDGSQQRLQKLSWEMLATRLLRGQLAAHLTIADTRVNVDTIAGLGLNGKFASDIQISAPAETMSLAVPILSVWKPSGTLRISAGEVKLAPLQIVQPAVVQWNSANVSIARVPQLGDYELTISPDNNQLNLALKTSNGALVLNGAGQYNFTSGGEFHGTGSAAAGYKEQLTPLLRLMGKTNNDGSVNLAIKLPAYQ
ncbi:MAG: type II secretion system protein N [Pseudomonadota bacterium]